MTKASAILVAPQIALREIPRADRETLSRILFQCVKGLDAVHDRRWRRFCRRFFFADAGEVQHFEVVVNRSGPFHRMHMAMEQRLFDSQERWVNVDRFRDWLKTGAGWGAYEYHAKSGRTRFVPFSMAYDLCTDDEMRDVHAAMVEYLRSPYPQRRLWPHLGPKARAEMMETIMAERDP